MTHIGFDHHKKWTQAAAIDDQARIIREMRVLNDRNSLKGFLKGLPKPSMGVVEAGPTWGWIYNTLSELGVKMIVANPNAVRAIAEAKITTDKIDARMLPVLLRVELIPELYVPIEEVRDQKMLWRDRICWSGCMYGLKTESIDCSTTIMSRCQNSAIFLDLPDADSWKS